MSEAADKEPERLARTVVYQSQWVNLYVDKVLFPDGRIIEKHHLLDFERQAVAALVENEQGELLFVQAYRYTTGTVGWELPAGGIELAESVIEAARREVHEESGFETAHHRQIYMFNTQPGISNHVAHVVYCKVRSDVAVGSFDKNEIKTVRWIAQAEIHQMLRDKIIRDGITLVGLLLWLNRMV